MKRPIFVVIAMFVALLSTGFPGNAQDNEEITLQVAVSDVSSLDPTALSRFSEGETDIVENLFIGLTRLNARTGEVEPYLATTWQVSPDGFTWTFTLRDDVQWVQVNSGTPEALRPVLASDVVFAIQRACDPTRPSPATTNIFIIEGCRNVQNTLNPNRVNQAFLDNEIGVRAIDDTTLEVRLILPGSYFLTLTTLPEFRPLPAELVVGAGSWPTVATLATSGPWVVETWNQQQMLLSQNPLWELQREGNATAVDVRFDIGADDVPVLLSSGTLDAVRLSSEGLSTLQFAPNTTVDANDGSTRYLVGFSFEYVALNDPRVRQALLQAIDRDALAAVLGPVDANDYRAIEHLTPDNVIATPTITGVGFDVSSAQQLLASAGYPGCQGLPGPLTLAVHDDPLEVAIGQFIVSQWEQNLGCAGTFVAGTATRQELVDNAHGTLDLSEESGIRRFPMWLVSWTADYPDADAWLAGALHCVFGFLKPGRTCDNADTLLDEAVRTTSANARSLSYTQVELSFFGDGGSFPVMPLVETVDYVAYQNRLSNVASYGPFQFDRWQTTVE